MAREMPRRKIEKWRKGGTCSLGKEKGEKQNFPRVSKIEHSPLMLWFLCRGVSTTIWLIIKARCLSCCVLIYNERQRKLIQLGNSIWMQGSLMVKTDIFRWCKQNINIFLRETYQNATKNGKKFQKLYIEVIFPLGLAILILMVHSLFQCLMHINSPNTRSHQFWNSTVLLQKIYFI